MPAALTALNKFERCSRTQLVMFKSRLRSSEILFGFVLIDSAEHFLLNAVFDSVDALGEPLLVLLDSVLVDELHGVQVALEERGLVQELERHFGELGALLVQHLNKRY